MRHVLRLFLVMLLASGNAVAAALPETVFQQWLVAYNSGDVQAQQRLVRTYAMTGEQAPGFGLRESMGPFSLLTVQASNDERVQAFLDRLLPEVLERARG